MSQERMIPKRGHVPDLSEKVIELLSKLCFRKQDNTKPVDVILSFGTGKDMEDQAIYLRHLLSYNCTNTVILTGGIPTFADLTSTEIPESVRLAQKIPIQEYPNIRFVLEKESLYMTDNVIKSLDIIDRSNIQSIGFVSQSFSAGRAFLILHTLLPDKELYQYSYMPHADTGEIIDIQNRYMSEYGRQRVRGEFLRIREYGRKGYIDIASVAGIVDDISAQVDE